MQKKIIYDIDNEIMLIKYRRVRDHCNFTVKYRSAAHSICNLKYKTPEETPVIKELAEEFEAQFECLAENTEKHLTFSVPIKKELDNGKHLQIKSSSLIVLDLCQVHY